MSENPEMEHSITDCAEKLKESLKKIHTIWASIYGTGPELTKKMSTMQDIVKQTVEDQIEDGEKERKNLVARVNSLAKEAINLEKALGLPCTSTHQHLSSAPLRNQEYKLKELISSYQEIRRERINEYSELKDLERQLCESLGETPQMLNDNIPQKLSENISPRLYVPTGKDIAKAVERINTLRSRQALLEKEFVKAMSGLKMIMEESESMPINTVEKAAFGYNVEFPCTRLNLEMLVESTLCHQLNKEEYNKLINQISQMWTKMGKSKEELKQYLSFNSDSRTSTIKKLKGKLQELEREIQEHLKELVNARRAALEQMWRRCCYSDEQCNQFKPYSANHYTEDALDLFDQEIERLQTFFIEHEHIYQLAARHNELWENLLHVEERTKRKSRLFKNRGAELLQEERDRKVMQKNITSIRGELIPMLEKYRNKTGNDFLYFGKSLLKIIDQKEEERKCAKENEKLQRKAAKLEALQLEIRLGVRPATPIDRGRRKLTPQSTKVNREEAAALRRAMKFSPRTTPFSKTLDPSKPFPQTQRMPFGPITQNTQTTKKGRRSSF